MAVGDVEVGEIAETVELGDEQVELTVVSVGNPTRSCAEPDREGLLRLGPQLEVNGHFPERTNVQLVHVDGPHDDAVAVWERGAGRRARRGPARSRWRPRRSSTAGARAR